MVSLGPAPDHAHWRPARVPADCTPDHYARASLPELHPPCIHLDKHTHSPSQEAKYEARAQQNTPQSEAASTTKQHSSRKGVAIKAVIASVHLAVLLIEAAHVVDPFNVHLALPRRPVEVAVGCGGERSERRESGQRRGESSD